VKKIYFVLSILALFLSACSVPSLFPAAPTAPVDLPVALPTDNIALPSVTSSATPTSLPTDTPVVAVATSTAVPADTSTVTGTPPTATSAITASPTLQKATATSTPFIQPTPEGPVFQSVTVSGNQFIWGDTCQSNSIIFTAQVASGFNVNSVYLFTRLQSSNGNVTSLGNDEPFTMHNDGMGTFTYEVAVEALKYYQDYNTASVLYQLVAENYQNEILERSQVYKNVTVTHCP
jgi:hypothetical protein